MIYNTEAGEMKKNGHGNGIDYKLRIFYKLITKKRKHKNAKQQRTNGRRGNNKRLETQMKSGIGSKGQSIRHRRCEEQDAVKNRSIGEGG